MSAMVFVKGGFLPPTPGPDFLTRVKINLLSPATHFRIPGLPAQQVGGFSIASHCVPFGEWRRVLDWALGNGFGINPCFCCETAHRSNGCEPANRQKIFGFRLARNGG
jgi:hypothetical protein